MTNTQLVILRSERLEGRSETSLRLSRRSANLAAMITRALAASAAVLALAACSEPAAPPEKPAAPAAPEAAAPAQPAQTPAAPVDGGLQGGTDQWKQVADKQDHDRIALLQDAWKQALREANHEFGAQIDSLGMVAVPDAALDKQVPAPGKYRCRTIKIGSMDGAGLAYVAYPFFTCTVELTPGGDLILTKTTGSQRTRGLIYPNEADPKRLVYVGAQAWGDEKTFPNYGQNPERNQIGVVERIGANRWRLVLPWPKQEAKLEILEFRQ